MTDKVKKYEYLKITPLGVIKFITVILCASTLATITTAGIFYFWCFGG